MIFATFPSKNEVLVNPVRLKIFIERIFSASKKLGKSKWQDSRLFCLIFPSNHIIMQFDRISVPFGLTKNLGNFERIIIMQFDGIFWLDNLAGLMKEFSIKSHLHAI